MLASIEIRVQPNSNRREVVVGQDGVIRVYVTEAPVDGHANKAVIKLLAKHIGVPRNAIDIERGVRSRDKVVTVTGVGKGEVQAKLMR